MEAPIINVGILTQKALSFDFCPEYVQTESDQFLKGEQRALLVNDKIVFNGKLYDELYFEPTSSVLISIGNARKTNASKAH